MEIVKITTELKSHFLRLYQIALADENFSHLEMQLLYKFAEERGISELELDDILTGYAGEVIVPELLEEKMAYLYDFALMIWADKLITEDERVAMKKYIRKFEFIDDVVEELCAYLLKSAQQNKKRQDILNELKEE